MNYPSLEMFYITSLTLRMLLATWLRCVSREDTFKKFKVNDFNESYKINDKIQAYIVELFEDCIVRKSLLVQAVQRLGWKKAHDILVTAALPTSISIKSGRFGEFLVGCIVSEFFGFSIPIKKLQYAVTANGTQFGTDVVAVKISNQRLSEVCYIESKLRTTPENGIGIKAYEQLKKDYAKPYPDIIRFIINTLEAEHKEQEYILFLDYLAEEDARPSKDLFRIGFIWENAEWDDELLARMETEIDNSKQPALWIE